jgi:bifunctional non-homologous end joining protein LigD
LSQLNQTLRELEERNAEGMLQLPTGAVLRVSNLAKLFWANTGHTKGDLLRHYVDVSPMILPVVSERPLVMKRHPDGAAGPAFYQHRAPEPLPKGARAVALPHDDVPSRLVGGDLFTLLYMAQLGTISQDPWFSKADAQNFPCEVAFDLDPMPGVPFAQVREVALALHETLVTLQVPHFAKTSGATGLHIFVPLAAQTAYEPARLFTQIVATMLSAKHPKIATVERTVNARGPKVYIDYLQNIEGKTLACAYSVRASAFAGVSTPVTWEEIETGIEPEAFTISTIAERLSQVGDLWAPLRDPHNALGLDGAIARLAAFQGTGKRR